jgi:hypothetical protein
MIEYLSHPENRVTVFAVVMLSYLIYKMIKK